MTKDWVHGVGHSPVCQILLQIVVRAVITSSEKLKDPNVLENFQAMIGGKFAPLTIMNNEDTDIHSMITTFNTTVTETASEIYGEHHQKKKPWVTAEILDQCD